jgi:hypothetical protein
MTIFKSATWYALTKEESDEIVLCKDQPVLEAYIEVVCKAAVRICKFKMPVESRDAFEKQVFHPGPRLSRGC